MIKKIIQVTLVYFAFISMAFADTPLDQYRNRNIESANNYIFLLIHGTGDDATCFDKAYDFMRKPVPSGGLGLTKVYKFSFRDKFGSIRDWADEIDQQMNRALQSSGTSEADFIFICHSAGGLAARYYVNNSGLYRGNIKKIVMINTPNLGSSSGKASIWMEKNRSERYLIPLGLWVLAYSPISINEAVLRYCTANLSWYYFATSVLTDGVLWKLDRGDYQLVREQVPGSQILEEINSASSPNLENPSYSIIASAGVPTANNIDSTVAYITEMNVYARLIACSLFPPANSEMGSIEEKLTASGLTAIMGYPMFEDGDFVSSTNSQLAREVSNLSGAKRIRYTYKSASIGGIAAAIDSALAASFFVPWPANVGIAICAGIGATTTVISGASIVGSGEDDSNPIDYIMAHLTMKESTMLKEKEINGTKATYLEHALFDSPVDGSASIRAINQTPFTLSSNLTNESGTIKTLSAYHVVSPEALNEAPAGYKLGTPIVIGGEEKYIESFTVKEPPTKIEGVLRDFMPLKMQYFQYSENFTAWKNIKILDEWGNFQIDGLKLAEGQNMIAFRAKNKVGYESNQHLKIIINTIPMVVSNMFPLPNSYTNNNKTIISGEFNKSVYSTNTIAGEGIPDITSAELYKDGKLYKNLINDPDFKEESIKVNDYKTVGKFSYKPSSPLPDGEYKITVKAKSEVGISQGVWSFWIDTKPPEAAIGSIEVISLHGKPVAVKYFVDDEISNHLKNVSIDITDKYGNVIITLATYESLSKGEHFVVIDPGKLKKLKQ